MRRPAATTMGIGVVALGILVLAGVGWRSASQPVAASGTGGPSASAPAKGQDGAGRDPLDAPRAGAAAPMLAAASASLPTCRDAEPARSAGLAAPRTATAAAPAPVSEERDAQRLWQMLRARSPVGELAALALQASTQVEREFNVVRSSACTAASAACTAAPRRTYAEIAQAVYAEAATAALPLALRSGQPAAFQVALHLCQRLPRPQAEACSRPLLQAWTTAEPDNATPWLMRSAAEREWGEPQAADEALYRASIATRMHDGSAALWGLLGEPRLLAESTAAVQDLHQHWGALIAGMNYASLGNIAGLCTDKALRDGNLMQRCDAIAERMVQAGSSLIHRVEGLALAQRLDWPQDRLTQQRTRVQALLKADSEELTAQAELGPCEALLARRDRALRIANRGEVAGLEAQASSGRAAR